MKNKVYVNIPHKSLCFIQASGHLGFSILFWLDYIFLTYKIHKIILSNIAFLFISKFLCFPFCCLRYEKFLKVFPFYFKNSEVCNHVQICVSMWGTVLNGSFQSQTIEIKYHITQGIMQIQYDNMAWEISHLWLLVTFL